MPTTARGLFVARADPSAGGYLALTVSTPEPTHHDHGIRWGVVALIGAVTLLGVLGPKLLWMIDAYRNTVRSWPVDAQYMVHPTMRMLLVLAGWILIVRVLAPGRQPTMGLAIGRSRAIKGAAIGVLCSLPMLVLGLFSDESSLTRHEVLYTGLMPGFTEEVFYRAFMFGLLVQAARCPVWTTAIITGVVFGLAHVDLTPEPGQTILGQIGPWIGIIALGGFMYAWLFWESGWNLWLVIALHAGMNLWWDMFDLSATPLGGLGATTARFLAVGLAVFLVFGLRALGPRPSDTIGDEQPATDA